MTGLKTKLCNIGRDPKKYARVVNAPIFRTSTFVYDDIDEFLQDDSPVHTDVTYGRTGTPTVFELESAINELSESKYTLITCSGLAAIVITIMSVCKAGDHVLIPDNTYKCTKRFAHEELERFGISYSYYNPISLDSVKAGMTDKTRVLFIESPGSGTFELQDVKELASFAKKYGIVTISDNTWATPINYNPLKCGVDIMIMSLTKYFCGHADIIAGSISCNNDEMYKHIKRTHLNFGMNASPDDAYLMLRSLRTLSLRLSAHFQSALKVAQFLESHPCVLQVLYPPLPSSASHNIWKRDYTGASGVMSFALKQEYQSQVKKFIGKLKIFKIGLSWGCFESLIVPYMLTDLINGSARVVSPNLMRLNIGLETTEDLIQDLSNALEYIKRI